VPELDSEDVREPFVYSYRVIYRVEQRHVLVVAILRGKRLLGDVEGRMS